MKVTKHIFIYKDFTVETESEMFVTYEKDGIYVYRIDNDYNAVAVKIDMDKLLLWIQLNELGGIEEITSGGLNDN